MAKFPLSCPDPVLNLTEEFINRVRLETGLKLTRSGLVQILFSILLKAERNVDVKNVYDNETLRDAILTAIRGQQ